MELAVRTDGPVDVVTVKAERIDAAVAVAFKDSFKSATEGGQQTVILDLSEVAFLDSSGLGALVAAQKTLGNKRSMELAGLREAVARVMTLTRMDTVFRIHASVDAAEDSHRSSAA